MTAPIRRLTLVAIALCAFALRATHVGTILHSPVRETLVEDARAYQLEALRLTGADSASREGPSFLNLGYPYALAAVYSVVGVRVGAVLFAQAGLGALSCVLLALAARRLFASDAAAIVAGSALALYRPAVFYDGLLLTPSLTSFAVVVSMCFAVAGSGARRWRIVLLLSAGAWLGWAALLRPNVVILVPALVAGMAWLSPAQTQARGACAFLLGTMAIVLPVTVAQRIAHGAWVPLSANAGMNFWTGNQREASGAYEPAAFVDEQNAGGEESGFLEEARRRSGRTTMPLAESDRFWLDQGLRDVRSDPARWLLLEGRKILLFGSRLELRTNVSIGFYERLSPVLRRTPIGFPLLFAAGLAGFVALLCARSRPEATIAAATVVAAAATCALFFVASEYRHLAAPGLALGSGALAAHLMRRGRSTIPLCAGALALAWSLSFAPVGLVAASDAAVDFSNFSRAICVDGLKSADPVAAMNRADALLDLAPTELAKRAYVDDARFWVRTLAARDGTRETLVRALDAAEALAAALPKAEGPAYSRAFRLRVRSTFRERLTVLASSPGLNGDSELRARIERLKKV